MITEAMTLGRFTALRRGDRFLLFVSILAGVGYLAGRAFEPYPGSVILKALGVSPLVLFAMRTLTDRDGLILGTSLIFSVGGDVFLGLNREDYFVFGLGSFLIAHILYVVLFIRSMPTRLIASPLQKMGVGALLAYSVGMLVWIFPNLGELALPVILYIAVITAMGVTAILAGFHAPWVVVGSLLFIFSDSVIAINKFQIAFAAAPFLIWTMYYAGQYLIVVGFVREKRKEEYIPLSPF